MRGLLVVWAAAATLLCEAVTIVSRLMLGPAEVYIAGNPPLLLQMHHMFWAAPLLVGAGIARSHRHWRCALLALSIGLIASDLLHHFVVLPLWIGRIGWHWP